MNLQISEINSSVNSPSPGNVNEGNKCESNEKSKEKKIATIADKAMRRLSEGMSAHEVANYIRGQSISCFSVTAQSARQDDILAKMKELLGTKKYPGVTLKNLEEVANNLGKSLKK